MKDNEQYIKQVFQKYEETKKDKRYKIKNKLIKTVAIVIITIGTTAGIVYASNIIYQKIWKEPEKYNFFEDMQVSLDDKNKSIDEQEAIQNAIKITKELGKDFGNIKNAEIKKIDGKTQWYIKTDTELSIDLDAKTGKLIHYSDFSVDDTKVPSKVTRQEAEKIIKEIYLKLGYKDKEYELASLEKSSISDDANIWQANFCKKYDGIYNNYQCIRISVVPEVNHLLMLTIFDDYFENNPIVITQNEATEIAKNKASKLRKDAKIQNIETKLDIKKMNAYVYSREQSEEQNNNLEVINETTEITDFTSYRSEEIVRKVWVIKISYANDLFTDMDMYFVDCTTGEIIGGDSTK